MKPLVRVGLDRKNTDLAHVESNRIEQRKFDLTVAKVYRVYVVLCV